MKPALTQTATGNGNVLSPMNNKRHAFAFTESPSYSTLIRPPDLLPVLPEVRSRLVNGRSSRSPFDSQYRIFDHLGENFLQPVSEARTGHPRWIFKPPSLYLSTSTVPTGRSKRAATSAMERKSLCFSDNIGVGVVSPVLQG